MYCFIEKVKVWLKWKLNETSTTEKDIVSNVQEQISQLDWALTFFLMLYSI